MVELSLKRDYKKRIAQIYTVLGTCSLWVEEYFPAAFKHLGEALKISGESNDIVSLVLSTYWLWLAHAWNCEFEKGLLHMERAL